MRGKQFWVDALGRGWAMELRNILKDPYANKLMDFIDAIEKTTVKIAIKVLCPMQPGDVEKTWADTSALLKNYNYKPSTKIDKGTMEFVRWYKDYYRNR